MMILKLQSSVSSPVATSLEMSMPHQPAMHIFLSHFPFPRVSLVNPSQYCIRFRLVGFIHAVASLHYYQVVYSNSTFCFVYTVNREIFMYENIHVLNICVNKFSRVPHENILTQNFVKFKLLCMPIKRLLAMYASLFCYRNS